MKGIDISAWQSEVNWQGLKDEGFEFVIVKLGEYDKLSDTFVEQVNEAVANGMKIGVYYYSHSYNENDAITEAEWVAEQVNSYLGQCPSMGIWFDIEDAPILDGGHDLNLICKTFVSRIKELGLDYVGVYSSYSWLAMYNKDIGKIPIDINLLGNIPIWVAQYNYQNDLSAEYPNSNVKIWQFTDHYSDDLPYDANIYYL